MTGGGAELAMTGGPAISSECNERARESGKTEKLKVKSDKCKGEKGRDFGLPIRT
jgi:hypothetical protein